MYLEENKNYPLIDLPEPYLHLTWYIFLLPFVKQSDFPLAQNRKESHILR